MLLPPPDLRWFAENLSETAQEIIDAWSDSNSVPANDEASPDLLLNAMEQLTEVLRLKEWGDGLSSSGEGREQEGRDVSELGEYGLSMLSELSLIAGQLHLESQIERLEQLALSLALWVLHQDGELNSIELVVNGIARLANHSLDHGELERIYFTMGEILDSLTPAIPGETETWHEPPEVPWQLLLLNRAIVATRLESPPLMEDAFSDVAELMPERAPSFFREGLEQVRIQSYPDPVREVIERYYRDWPSEKILH